MKRFKPGDLVGPVYDAQAHVCLASDVADLERRYREAMELIAKLLAGVERYSSDLCREADEFMEAE